jgi:hypothetical protein
VDVAVSDPRRAVVLLAERLGITRVEHTAERELRVFDGLDRVAAIARVLVSAGLELTRLCPREEDLEAYFLRLTGREA